MRLILVKASFSKRNSEWLTSTQHILNIFNKWIKLIHVNNFTIPIPLTNVKHKKALSNTLVKQKQQCFINMNIVHFSKIKKAINKKWFIICHQSCIQIHSFLSNSSILSPLHHDTIFLFKDKLDFILKIN